MSVYQAQCGAHPHCVPENTDAAYGIKKRVKPNFLKIFFDDKLAPGESKNKVRAKVGLSRPLRGVPVSGWVSNTLRGLIVRLKSSLFLVQVYGTANETLLIIPESSYSYLRSTRITSGYPVGVLSVSMILIKTCVS